MARSKVQKRWTTKYSGTDPQGSVFRSTRRANIAAWKREREAAERLWTLDMLIEELEAEK
jgi:hypothetical protein